MSSRSRRPAAAASSGRARSLRWATWTPRPLLISLKCDPELAPALRAANPGITAGYHLNKRHWNTVDTSARGCGHGVGDGGRLLRPGGGRACRRNNNLPWSGAHMSPKASRGTLDYPHLGLTRLVAQKPADAAHWPTGFAHVDKTLAVGAGQDAFAALAEGIMTWQIQRRAGLAGHCSAAGSRGCHGGERIWCGKSAPARAVRGGVGHGAVHSCRPGRRRRADGRLWLWHPARDIRRWARRPSLP